MEIRREVIIVGYRMIRENSNVDLPTMINMSGFEDDLPRLFMAIITAGEIQIHDGKYTFIYPNDEECADAFINETTSVKVSTIDGNTFCTIYLNMKEFEDKKRLQKLLHNTL